MEDKMKAKNFRTTISSAALTLALMFGVMIASSASAQAQYRDYNGRYGYQQWSRDRVTDYAFKLAYHNAYTDAERLGRSRFRPSYRDMPGYRNDNTGYMTWMGYQNDYHSAYRRGYEAGFNESMQGRARRFNRDDVERVLGADLERVYEHERGDRNGGRDRDDWRDRDDKRRGDRNDIVRIAQQNGYRDGLRNGQEDRTRRRGHDFERDNSYRDATSGYRSEFGNRDFYRQAYREGFRRGYEEGYRQNYRR